MRGRLSLGLAATAIWATISLQVLAAEIDMRNAAPIDTVIVTESVAVPLNLRDESANPSYSALSLRGASEADAAAAFSTMSDEELMEGTDSANAYHHEFHPCPIPCTDQLPQNWTVYTDIDRLALCNEPMLFDFNIYNPVVDPETPTKIRVCNAGDGDASKVGPSLVNGTSKGVTTSAVPRNAAAAWTACAAAALETKAALQFAKQGPGMGKEDDIANVLHQLEHYYATAECESTLMFGSAGGIIAGLYIGSGMGRGTVSSAIKGLQDSIKAGGSAQTIVSQLCGDQRPKTNTFGVAVSATGNITAIQNAVKSWNNAGCVTGLESTNELAGTTIWETPFELVGNGTIANGTSSNGTVANFIRRGISRLRNAGRAELARRGMCTTRTVESGDGCDTLAKKCGISPSDFTKYNPDSELCSGLQPGMLVCCSAGGMDDLIPKKGADGICATYHVISGDNCAAIAGRNGIKVKDIEKYNNKTTWGWYGCDKLMVDMNICLSDGK